MFGTVIQHRVTHVVAAGGLWWLLSWHGDWLMLSLGAASVAFSVYLTRRMLAIDGEAHYFVLNRELLAYWCWLAVAIIKSNLDVMRHVLSVPLKISPTWVRLHIDPKSEVGIATLAKSITLTPGTVTVDVEEDALTVHALTRDAAEYLQTGDMEYRARDPGRELRSAR